jgi:cytochrome b
MTHNILHHMTASIQERAPSRRIVELPMRLFHTFMAISFVGAYITAESERFRLLHVSLGYTLFGLVVFRLLWGMWGPRQSRLSVAWRKLDAIKELKADFQNFPESIMRWNAQTLRKWATLVLTMAAFSTLLVSIFISLSGYAVYNEIAGDWMAEIHELFGNFLLMAVLLHIAVIVLLVVAKKSQGLRPMWSGRRPGAGPDVAKGNHVWMAALLSLAVASFLFFQLT